MLCATTAISVTCSSRTLHSNGSRRIIPAKYDELLGITEQGYATVVACVAGYRAADDKYAATPKVRFATSDVIVEVS